MSFFKSIFGAKGDSEILSSVPKHIAIIPDGNGRWAKKRGLPRSVGHRQGSMALKKIVIYCSKIGVQYLTFYAFSTENWKRPQSEVDALMSLLLEFLRNAEKELEGSNVIIKVLGDVKALTPELQKEIERVQRITGANTGLHLNIALNYGSKLEIIDAVRQIAKDVKENKLSVDKIDDKAFEKYLYTNGIPDPDLLIRTSGEQRISNYLLWQCAYTEFYFPQKLWPDFAEKDIFDAIEAFNNRNRRYGGIKE